MDSVHLVADVNLGKDTWEKEELIKAELGKGAQEVSVFGIGPTGENLVKFTAIVGNRGYVAGHNGVGAVMGSKKLKAVAGRRLATVAEVSVIGVTDAIKSEIPIASLCSKWGMSHRMG